MSFSALAIKEKYEKDKKLPTSFNDKSPIQQTVLGTKTQPERKSMETYSVPNKSFYLCGKVWAQSTKWQTETQNSRPNSRGKLQYF